MKHSKRLANWDLLRSVAMLFVVVVHCLDALGQFGGVEAKPLLADFFLVCDPVFFCLSGYFAIRPPRTDLGTYYLRKVSAIILPIVVYSLLLYAWDVGTGDIPDPSARALFAYQAGLLDSSWWFMPELIPFLVLAPFLAPVLDGLSDRQLVTLAKVVGVLGAWGCAWSLATNVLQRAGLEEQAQLFAVAIQLVPAEVVPGSRYFVYFCMGYLVRRMSPRIGDRAYHGLVALGMAALAAGTVLRGMGFDRPDPSYYWLYATLAIFLVFDRVRITSAAASRALAWTAKRSYAIYLMQYTTISVMQPLLYEGAFDYAALPALGRVGVWCLLVASSYPLALGVASALDTTVLRLAQWAWGKAVVEPHARRVARREA